MKDIERATPPDGWLGAIDRFRIRLIRGTGKLMVFVLALLLVATFMPTRAYADAGYWDKVSETPVESSNPNDRGKTRQVWEWHSNGSVVSLEGITPTGATPAPQGNQVIIIVPDSPAGPPSWIPTGYTVREDQESGVDTRPTVNEVAEAGREAYVERTDWDEVVIASDTDLEVEPLDLANTLPRWAMHEAFNLLSGLIESIADLTQRFCKIIDVDLLFSQDFGSGVYSEFHKAASRVASGVSTNYGLAFLGVVFAISLIGLMDERRGGGMGPEKFGSFVEIVFMFVFAFTIVTHAMQLMEAIYWLGLQFTGLVRGTLASIGYSPTNGFSTSIGGMFSGPLAALQYKNFSSLFMYLILAVASFIVVIRCVAFIFTTAFLRMVELYMRAAFAPIPMAFLTSERTRHMFWNYIKHFAAVCFQAALIMMALSLSGLLFGVAETILEAATAAASGGFFDTIMSALPTLFALFTVTSIIRKTEQVSANLFGLG